MIWVYPSIVLCSYKHELEGNVTQRIMQRELMNEKTAISW